MVAIIEAMEPSQRKALETINKIDPDFKYWFFNLIRKALTNMVNGSVLVTETSQLREELRAKIDSLQIEKSVRILAIIHTEITDSISWILLALTQNPEFLDTREMAAVKSTTFGSIQPQPAYL